MDALWWDFLLLTGQEKYDHARCKIEVLLKHYKTMEQKTKVLQDMI